MQRGRSRRLNPLGITLATAAMVAAGATAQPTCTTYTTCSDFSQGVLSGSIECVDDALQLSAQTTTFPVMWIANAGEDSVSKWDTDLNREIGRYGTWVFASRPVHGAFDGPAPSRTAVDLDGNVFVANRNFTSGGRPSVMKILNTGYIDRNGNGVMDTCIDANNNGVIDAAEQLFHLDTNANGLLDTAELRDERIAWITHVGAAGGWGRSLAIDANGDVWLGVFNERAYYKISGSTGAVLGGPYTTVAGPNASTANTPYGAFVDRDGIMWGATLNNRILKFNTNAGLEGMMATITHPFSNYGITGTRLNPDGLGERTFVVICPAPGVYQYYDTLLGTFSSPSAGSGATVSSYAVAVDGAGNILAGATGSGAARKFSPSGALIWATTGTIVADRATIVDSNNDAWRIDLSGFRMQKLSGATGAVIATMFGATLPTGRFPYTYSDATGSTLQSSFPQGFWTGTRDSGCADTAWGTISWTESAPAGTLITVRARSSNDQLTWSPYETVSNGVPLTTTPSGRYLQWEVRMQVLAGNTSPILYDLTVCGTLPSIAIDINPNRTPNPVYLSRNYIIYVALLGNANTDVTALDWTTARFGPTGAEAAADRAPTYRDINNDGFMDALYGFRTFDCGFSMGQTSALFTITSPGGCTLSASDSIVVHP